MKYPTVAFASILVIGFLATGAKSMAATALPTKLPAKKSTTQKSSKTTQLPAYKSKKKVVIDFDSNASEHSTTVVVRTPLPLEQAEQDNNQAHSVTIIKKTVIRPQVEKVESLPVVVATPVPTNVAAPTPAPTPVPSSKFLVVAAPTPTPIAEPVVPSQPPLPTSSSVTSTSRIAKPKLEQNEIFYSEGNRFYARTSFVNAHYSELESDLQNGATTLAAGISHQSDMFEIRGTLEFGHGLDQSVTPQNTRFTLLRADGVYLFMPGFFTPLLSGGLGYADLNVTSYRSSDNGDLTVREHLKTSGFVFVPAGGMRLNFPSATVDFTAEYLTFVGTGHSSSLGGLTAALGIGIPF